MRWARIAFGVTLATTGIVAAALGAAAQEPDRRYLALPPVYPAPSTGFLPLPSSVAPPSLVRDPGAPADRPAWAPARLEVIVGIDARGHITSIVESIPGRFPR